MAGIKADKEQENKALYWLMSQNVNGEETLLEVFEGNITEKSVLISLNLLASWCAAYHKAMTPIVEQEPKGRKFKEV